MLTTEDYKRIAEIQERLLGLRFQINDNYAFTTRCLSLLEDVLGYNNSIFGYLKSGEKTVDTGSVVNSPRGWELHSVIVNAYNSHRAEFDKMGDKVVLSRIQNKAFKSSLERTVLHPYDFQDCLIQWIQVPPYLGMNKPRKYQSYIVIFSDERFSNSELEVLDALKDSIAYAQLDYIDVWNLKNHISMVYNFIDYFPMGVILVESLNNVTFTNALARQYLKDLGVTSENQYDTFFTSEIYPYCKDELLSFGSAYPIRIKNFLFNAVIMSNLGKSITNFQQYKQKANMDSPFVEERVSFMMDSAICIFIIDDDIYHTKFSVKELQSLGLTKREIEVAELIAGGITDREIADELNISMNTVRIHISNIFRKLNVKSRMQLIDKLMQTRV